MSGPLIVSDTSPLNYLVLIGAVDLLPKLVSGVLIPPAVAAERVGAVERDIKVATRGDDAGRFQQKRPIIIRNPMLDPTELRAHRLQERRLPRFPWPGK